jgi:hypothetical protein
MHQARSPSWDGEHNTPSWGSNCPFCVDRQFDLVEFRLYPVFVAPVVVQLLEHHKSIIGAIGLNLYPGVSTEADFHDVHQSRRIVKRTRYRGDSGKNIMPEISIRHGRHWNANGNLQENALVSGTFEAPYPTQVDTMKPTPIICWAMPTMRPATSQHTLYSKSKGTIPLVFG